jgi:hypothetical protein
MKIRLDHIHLHFAQTALLCALLISLFQMPAAAQSIVSGEVYGSDETPLPYCNVVIKGTFRGCITNEDGRFALMNGMNTDSLIFSYLSYKTKTVSASSLLFNSKIILQPEIYNLKVTTIMGNTDYLYELISQCRLQHLSQPEYTGKAYFSLETETDSIPLEVIECYYNATVKNTQLQELALKNGRIGLAPYNDFYFVSLNTSQIIKNYSLFQRQDKYFPGNPLQLTLKKLRKQYKLKLLSVGGENQSVYQIRFTPAELKHEFFQGEIWIDHKSGQLISLKLSSVNLRQHPFKPIKPGHKIDSLAINLNYAFLRDGLVDKADYVSFSYSFNYADEVSRKKLSTNGILYLFDHTEPFYIPRFQYNSGYTDYDKIISFPYNQNFWKHNEAIVLSNKKKSYLGFFSEHGVLLNYNELKTVDNALLCVKKVAWSARQRIDSQLLNSVKRSRNQSRNTSGGRTLYYDELYHLKGQIFMDVNKFADSVEYLTATIIDLDESFFDAPLQPYTNSFINTYFDLIEIQRLKLLRILGRGAWTIEQINTIYDTNINEIELTHKKYLKEVQRGNNTPKLLQWEKVVAEVTGIE